MVDIGKIQSPKLESCFGIVHSKAILQCLIARARQN